ncbi:MAG TPA: GTP 3',8-cyclase MoaA [Phnomibacter sp.]|nr:GTP 3',8-cyclase MoaA [Phnomibacter sp.]
MIKDGFGRVHDYLRISLTDNCNLRCNYCMPDEDYHFTAASKLMQADEIEAIAKIFVQNGVKKIRLTGGEPLVRKDAADILMRLAALPVKLTITTNGTRLHEFADVLQSAGITSLNISLDTLHREKFALLTRRDLFDQVYSNIELMLQKGFHVKLNAVAMRGVNDDELIDFVRWTQHAPVHVRFIEFMPFSGNRWEGKTVLTWHEMLDTISSAFAIEPLAHVAHDTAKKYKVKNAQGSFAFITTMSTPFCGDCNRMRLTADGKMKNCLFSKTETDLLTAYREGKDIVPLILQNIGEKRSALGGQFDADIEHVDASHIENRSMITIGG